MVDEWEMGMNGKKWGLTWGMKMHGDEWGRNGG